MKYQIMFLRIITIFLIFISSVIIYRLNMTNQISALLEENGKVDYSVDSVFFPSQSVKYIWHVESIAGVYFDQGGVIGQDFRLRTVELCQTNTYALDVTSLNNQEVSFTLQPHIFVFDPLFVSLIILLLVQCFYLLYSLSKRLDPEMTLRIHYGNIIGNAVKQFAFIGLIAYIVLPILELALKTLACS